MDAGAHIIVRGMVQGVGFRFFVYSRATRLGLLGYVKNLPDGNVEVVVEGDRSIIEELLKDLRVGPRSARVVDLDVRWKPAEHAFKAFSIH
jgi:acylphosphatase